MQRSVLVLLCCTRLMAIMSDNDIGIELLTL
jgi:hypothetical protein